MPEQKTGEGNSVNIISSTPRINELLERIDKVVKSDSSILLVGETGVGKEIFAEYVHQHSLRKDKPFVKISLSALPEDLLESELFGHEKGSFTSAYNVKKGLFEIANHGSIFLDDIDDVPLSIQTKLLRVLESYELLRVGGTTPIPVDVRLITASKIDLRILIEKGKFRSDLYYRVNVVPVKIPPLRQRCNDIEPLAYHFFKIYASNRDIDITSSALNAMMAYSWPGNVRELRNLIQRLSLFAEDRITIDDLPVEMRSGKPEDILVKACHNCLFEKEIGLEEVMHCLEKKLLIEAIEKAKGNQTKAAQKLKLSLSTFRDKIKKYNITPTNHSN
ncbi:MAG: sigma-54 dependent transcriptional regulator [Ignavibacteria bacterium]|jgi:transcriptional regulator with GAF, ATPase, and Fis domain